MESPFCNILFNLRSFLQQCVQINSPKAQLSDMSKGDKTNGASISLWKTRFRCLHEHSDGKQLCRRRRDSQIFYTRFSIQWNAKKILDLQLFLWINNKFHELNWRLCETGSVLSTKPRQSHRRVCCDIRFLNQLWTFAKFYRMSYFHCANIRTWFLTPSW